VGFVLDRLMSMVERNVLAIAALPGAVRRWAGALRPATPVPAPVA
jgi:hypothetical protein